MHYDLCPHGKINIENLSFFCADCVRYDERQKIYRMLKIFSVVAPKESYSATFTPEQFMEVISNPLTS